MEYHCYFKMKDDYQKNLDKSYTIYLNRPGRHNPLRCQKDHR